MHDYLQDLQRYNRGRFQDLHHDTDGAILSKADDYKFDSGKG